MTRHISTPYSPERQIAHEILQTEKSGDAIKFYEFYVDNYKDVTWTVYGDCKTNRIALVASNDKMAVGLAESSLALFPKMQDRIFGMPMEDHQLVSRLCSKLCLLYCGELRANPQ